ncbi:MAG TPA: ABC transporter ATP-binding protein [Candidatus Woesebacteria bacterium]|nr:ABC transporter ATP-binding protein [Candidatus Woesebacteria bacterium]
MTPIIKFENVTKKFILQNQKTFKEFLPALFSRQKTKNNLLALSNISFTISPGESLGIIGPNGSGKSTILKLIAGVTAPTSGRVTVNGRVSPLIELGAGFHPELSGRENIYLNGAILGLSQKEIGRNFDSIVNFADLWEFIDQPIKHYSSGMYMRLAFAVAVHTNPQILIIDEILAVGDAEFQEKCFQRMEEFKRSGVTIIFVSHSLGQIENFCHRVLHVQHGQLIADGPAGEICQQYQATLT